MEVVDVRQRPPRLRRPVLMAAFRGWNDAGEAASGTVAALVGALGADQFASIDAEEFFDFQATRPTVRLDGGHRRIDWPVNRLLWADLPGSSHQIVLLDGTEPNLRWRAFSSAVVDLAVDLGVELVVTLGALQVDVPHTRPVLVTGSASDTRLAERLGLRRSGYEGPTGITGVLHAACAGAGLDAVSLWAGVPHYLSATPFHAATLALSERVVRLLGADLSLVGLAREAAQQADEIGALVAEDDDLAEYVTELEERTAAAEALPDASGDEIAAELERFLRDRHGD